MRRTSGAQSPFGPPSAPGAWLKAIVRIQASSCPLPAHDFHEPLALCVWSGGQAVLRHRGVKLGASGAVVLYRAGQTARCGGRAASAVSCVAFYLPHVLVERAWGPDWQTDLGLFCERVVLGPEQTMTLVDQAVKARLATRLSTSNQGVVADALVSGLASLRETRRRHLRAERGLGRSRIEAAKRLMRDNLREHLSLREIARAVGWSESHFSRTFKASEGVSPYDYLTCLRVGVARAQIAAGKGLAETALDVGFYDQSHLARHFHAVVGISPGRYARAVRSRPSSDRSAD